MRAKEELAGGLGEKQDMREKRKNALKWLWLLEANRQRLFNEPVKKLRDKMANDRWYAEIESKRVALMKTVAEMCPLRKV